MHARLSTFLRLAVAVGLTTYVLYHSEPGAVLVALRGVSWPWILWACVLVLVDRALNAYRWIALLAPLGPQVPPIGVLMRIFFVSTFLGTFLPGSIGTDTARTWSLTSRGVPLAPALASVVLDRVLGVLSILIAVIVGLALAPGLIEQGWIVVALGVAAAGCAAALLFVFSERTDSRVRGLLARVPAGLQARLGRMLDALRAYRRHHALLAGVLLATVGVQGLRITQAWMLGRSLGIPVGFDAYLTFIPIILLVLLLPVTISGLGTAQIAFAWSFTQVGVTPADAFTLSVLFLALAVVGNLPGGLLYAMEKTPTAPR